MRYWLVDERTAATVDGPYVTRDAAETGRRELLTADEAFFGTRLLIVDDEGQTSRLAYRVVHVPSGEEIHDHDSLTDHHGQVWYFRHVTRPSSPGHSAKVLVEDPFSRRAREFYAEVFELEVQLVDTRPLPPPPPTDRLLVSKTSPRRVLYVAPTEAELQDFREAANSAGFLDSQIGQADGCTPYFVIKTIAYLHEHTSLNLTSSQRRRLSESVRTLINTALDD